jgi:hypothetical protein
MRMLGRDHRDRSRRRRTPHGAPRRHECETGQPRQLLAPGDRAPPVRRPRTRVGRQPARVPQRIASLPVTVLCRRCIRRGSETTAPGWRSQWRRLMCAHPRCTSSPARRRRGARRDRGRVLRVESSLARWCLRHPRCRKHGWRVACGEGSSLPLAGLYALDGSLAERRGIRGERWPPSEQAVTWSWSKARCRSSTRAGNGAASWPRARRAGS